MKVKQWNGKVGASAVIGLCLVGLPGVGGVAHAEVCPAESSQEDPSLGRIFSAYDVTGTFVLLDVQAGTCLLFNSERAGRRFLPASTFKVFNGMVALDEGSIADSETVLEWDGLDRGFIGWNEDQNMRIAFRRSTVWFYQELARRTGEKRMRYWLEREHYGNADPSGGIDRFWLDGGLRISANEQVEFLDRLLRGEVDFSPRAQGIGRELLIMERTDSYTLAGKTGWTQYADRQLGWYVGFIERGGETYVYALNFDSPEPDFPMRDAREALLRKILTQLGLLEQPGIHNLLKIPCEGVRYPTLFCPRRPGAREIPSGQQRDASIGTTAWRGPGDGTPGGECMMGDVVQDVGATSRFRDQIFERIR